MSTPIQTMIYLLGIVMSNLTASMVMTFEAKKQSHRFCNLMMGQLNFLKTFVSDLLDLRQMRDGVFTLANEPFDPNKIFDTICNLFEP